MPNDNAPPPPSSSPPPSIDPRYYPTYGPPPPGYGPSSSAEGAELARLRAENAALQEEVRDARHEARDRRHELRTLQQQHTDLLAERDRLQAVASVDPEGLRKKTGELQGEIRTLKHRHAFERLARAQHVTEDSRIADLWALSGYRAESDEPDAGKLSELITAGLKTRPYLRDSDATGAGAPPTGAGAPPTGTGVPPSNGLAPGAPQPGYTPGPGADRGQTVQPVPAAGPPSQRPPGRL